MGLPGADIRTWQRGQVRGLYDVSIWKSCQNGNARARVIRRINWRFGSWRRGSPYKASRDVAAVRAASSHSRTASIAQYASNMCRSLHRLPRRRRRSHRRRTLLQQLMRLPATGFELLTRSRAAAGAMPTISVGEPGPSETLRWLPLNDHRAIGGSGRCAARWRGRRPWRHRRRRCRGAGAAW